MVYLGRIKNHLIHWSSARRRYLRNEKPGFYVSYHVRRRSKHWNTIIVYFFVPPSGELFPSKNNDLRCGLIHRRRQTRKFRSLVTMQFNTVLVNNSGFSRNERDGYDDHNFQPLTRARHQRFGSKKKKKKKPIDSNLKTPVRDQSRYGVTVFSHSRDFFFIYCTVHAVLRVPALFLSWSEKRLCTCPLNNV